MLSLNISSQISHELRIPLSAMLGMIHLLKMTALDQEQQEYLDALDLSACDLMQAEARIEKMVANNNKLCCQQ